MKNILTFLFIIASVIVTTTQKAYSQSEFSSATILVGNVVADLEKSLDFYTNVIGMTKTGGFSVDKEKATELGLSDKYTLDVAVLKLIDTPEASEWKIMSLSGNPGHKNPKWIHDDTGMQYITINVNHLDPIIKRIKENKVKILSGEPSKLGENRYFVLVQDPDGTFIELIGPR